MCKTFIKYLNKIYSKIIFRFFILINLSGQNFTK